MYLCLQYSQGSCHDSWVDQADPHLHHHTPHRIHRPQVFATTFGTTVHSKVTTFAFRAANPIAAAAANAIGSEDLIRIEEAGIFRDLFALGIAHQVFDW